MTTGMGVMLWLAVTIVAAGSGSSHEKPDQQAETQKKEDALRGTIPGLKIDNIMASEEGATLLVFRVHELGRPVRVNVE